MATPDDGPTLTGAGKFVIFLVILACFGGAYWMFANKSKTAEPQTVSSSSSGNPQPSVAQPASSGPPVTIGLAYGTEKVWLLAALDKFKQTPEGANITVNIDRLGLGSIEAADLIMKDDADAHKINVWFPANSLPRQKLEADWSAKFGGSPINVDDREASMLLTPMVFIFWDERYEAFVQKYKVVSFNTVAQAIAPPGTWGAIAGKPEWGYFKFGHTHPRLSNSGLMTLVCMAYDFKDSRNKLSNADVADVEFKKWMDGIERAVDSPANGTDILMRDMIGKGPSAYDCVFVYESVAIDYVKKAAGRWGKLRIVYPKYNVWNDNPFYVLNVPWSTPEQCAAAEALRKFLNTDEIQKMALDHGFRPGNLNVAVNGPDSPFKLYEANGIQADLGSFPPVPSWETVANLLIGWAR